MLITLSNMLVVFCLRHEDGVVSPVGVHVGKRFAESQAFNQRKTLISQVLHEDWFRFFLCCAYGCVCIHRFDELRFRVFHGVGSH